MSRTKLLEQSKAAPPCILAQPWRRPIRLAAMSSVRVIWISLILVTTCEAADHGQFGPQSPETKAWANSLQNKLKEGCCSTADGWKPEEVEYDIKGNKYRVKIDGEWYLVPPMAIIDGPNRFGFPVVWYHKTWDNGITPSILIRCFIPGAGG
jgi:hypothetical protein